MTRILNVDIGGATTKLALIDCGRVLATAAMHGGGRQIVLDARDRIVRIEPELQSFARSAGIVWDRGDTIARKDMRARSRPDWPSAFSRSYAERKLTANDDGQFITSPLAPSGKLDGVQFSGGVAEYVYGQETRDFGDLGRALGVALAVHIANGGVAVRPCWRQESASGPQHLAHRNIRCR